jgi:D-inositol-3-phosphate glycosyltransferase
VTTMRVLLVSANYQPSVGGIERYVEILAHGLAERGHRVTVASCRTHGGAAHERDGAVEIVRVPATDVLHSGLGVPYPLPEPVTATRTFRRLVADADVVNPQDALYATSVLTLALARRRRVPSVLTQHVAFVPQRHRALDAAEHAAVATVGRSARLATRVVAYNPAVADWARQTWRLADVAVLPPGVPATPPVDRQEVRRSFGLPTDRFVALFVGRDVPKKGLDLFLGARDPAYDLLALSDRAAADVWPFVEPERFRQLLASVDAFVLPSTGEGFPLALQEALVTGVPCVVTAGPGYERYLGDGDVLVVERSADAIRDALRALAADESLRARYAARAAEAGAREFGVEPFIDAYEELFRALV